MSKQQTPDDRAREVMAPYFTWAMPTSGEEFGEYPTWDQLTDEDQVYGLRIAGEQLAALTEAGLVVSDAAELAQLHADLDAAMRFGEAERIAGRYKPPVLGVPQDLAQEMAEARIALAPALDRWRQRRRQEAANDA